LKLTVVDRAVNAVMHDGLSDVKDAIANVVNELKGISDILPASFGRVRQAVQDQFGSFDQAKPPKTDVRMMTLGVFRQMCAEVEEKDEDQQDVYLRILHALGDVLYAPLSPELDDKVINTHWARKALYSLLTDKVVGAQRGIMYEQDRKRIFAGEAGTLLMTLAQAHSIIFNVEARQIDPESGERERAWLIPDLLETRDEAYDDWVKGDPAEIQNYGRFLAERVFLQFMGEYRHCIRSVGREAFRDEVVFTEPQTGARAVVRPDYEGPEHSIGIWAEPRDKSGKAKDWCRTIKSWLTGTVELREASDAMVRGGPRVDKPNIAFPQMRMEGTSRPELQARAERFVETFFFPKPQYLLAWILGCAESTLSTIITGEEPGLLPSKKLIIARENASSAKGPTPNRGVATTDTGVGKTLKASVVEPKNKMILDEELGRLAHKAKGELIEELIKIETNEKKRAECRRRANLYREEDLRLLLATRRVAAE
jgi:C-terminal of Roc, COR, domain